MLDCFSYLSMTVTMVVKNLAGSLIMVGNFSAKALVFPTFPLSAFHPVCPS